MDTRVTNTVVDGGVGEGDAAGRRLGVVLDGRHGEGDLVQEEVEGLCACSPWPGSCCRRARHR